MINSGLNSCLNHTLHSFYHHHDDDDVTGFGSDLMFLTDDEEDEDSEDDDLNIEFIFSICLLITIIAISVFAYF